MTVVVPPSVTHEITVDGPPGEPLSTVLGRIGRAGTASVGGVLVDPSHPLGRPPLLDGCVVTVGSVAPAPTEPDGVCLAVTGGPDAGWSVPLRRGRLVIGRSGVSDLVVADPRVSRRHAVVRVTPGGITIEDLGSTNGTRVEDESLGRGPARLEPGQVARVGDTRLAVVATSERPAPTSSDGGGTVSVCRAPRLEAPIAPAEFLIPCAPAPPIPARLPWLAVLAPVPVAVVLAVLWGPQLLAVALLGLLVSAATTWSDRRATRRSHAAALAAHARRRDEVAAAIAVAVRTERASLRRRCADPAETLARCRRPGRLLWERSADDDDVATVRIGTGRVRATVSVRAEAGAAPEPTPTLADAPVTLDLRAVHVLGITGDPARCAALAGALLGGLLAAVPPGDLRLWAVGGGGAWTWLDLVPHRSGLDLPDEAVVDILAARERARATPVAGDVDGLDLLVVLRPTAEVPGLGPLLSAARAGRTMAVVVDTGTGLPPQTRCVVTVPRSGPDRVSGAGAATIVELSADGVGPWWTDRVGRALAPLRPAGRDVAAADPPREARLLDLLPFDGTDPAELRQAWASDDGGLAAVVGRGARGPHVLDLVGAGPHMLVGGTTGAGKSELLQTLVTSLATGHSPESVSFVLIDYKGGAAFRGCAQLPHTVGVVTDLDPALAERALVSLEAEVRRRERLLARHDSTSLADYRAAGHHHEAPLPRLLLVVDELRMLIDELPSFVTGMVRIASLGRSLGIHLVLATQRPAGAVTPDIAANVNLRVALRVRDRADSDQIIGSTIAALIPEELPGRAYASTGQGEPVPFQVATVTGHAPGSRPTTVRLDGRLLPPPSRPSAPPTPDDLTRIAGAARHALETAHLRVQASPWLAPLPDAVTLGSLATSASGGVVWGLSDDPHAQRQDPLVWPPDRPGGLALVGPPGSGRTTALRALLAAVGPHGNAAYVLDGGTELAEMGRLPHVGAVVPVTDEERSMRLLDRLVEEIHRRQAGALREPRLVLGVDGWEQVAAVEGSDDVLDRLLAVARDGHRVGVHLVVTGGRALLLGRAHGLAGTTYALGRPDPAEAALLGLRLPSRANAEPPPGRAVLAGGRITAQLAHVGRDPSAEGQAMGLETLADRLPAVTLPFRVPVLPTRVMAREAPHALALDADLVPCGFDGASTRRLVSGPRGSGRTTVLLRLAELVAERGTGVVVVTRRPSEWTYLSGRVRVVDPEDPRGLVDVLTAGAETEVLVDDAESLPPTPADAVLVTHARRRADLVVTAAVDALALPTLFRGLVVDVSRHRTGLLLSPSGALDGEPFGIRVPSGPLVAGRGWLVEHGRPRRVQVARPSPDQRVDATLGRVSAL